MTDGAEPRRVGLGALVLLLRALKRAMNPNQLDISLTLVPGCDSSGLQVQVKEKFSSLNYAICQWAELNIIHTGCQITVIQEKSHAKYAKKHFCKILLCMFFSYVFKQNKQWRVPLLEKTSREKVLFFCFRFRVLY